MKKAPTKPEDPYVAVIEKLARLAAKEAAERGITVDQLLDEKEEMAKREQSKEALNAPIVSPW